MSHGCWVGRDTAVGMPGACRRAGDTSVMPGGPMSMELCCQRMPTAALRPIAVGHISGGNMSLEALAMPHCPSNPSGARQDVPSRRSPMGHRDWQPQRAMARRVPVSHRSHPFVPRDPPAALSGTGGGGGSGLIGGGAKLPGAEAQTAGAGSGRQHGRQVAHRADTEPPVPGEAVSSSRGGEVVTSATASTRRGQCRRLRHSRAGHNGGSRGTAATPGTVMGPVALLP